MYGIYMDREAQEYGKYQDNLDNWYTHLDFLQKDAATKSQEDYSRWQDKVGMDYDLWQDGYDGWLDQYNQADKDYWNLYDRDYNAWSDETSMGFDDHWKNTEMDYQKDRDKVEDERWQQETDRETKQANYNKLVDIINASGYIPPKDELKAAGMTEKESYELRKGYKNSQKTGDDDTPTYEKMDLDVVRNNFRKLSTVEDIKDYSDQLYAEGYNPKTIISLENAAIRALNDGNGVVDTTVDETGTPTPATATPTTTTVDPFKERQQQNREKSNKGRSRK